MPGERLPEEVRRRAILEAAYRVALRDRLSGLSMRAVAEEAEVSKGLVFFHFSDKESLVLALLDALLERALVLEPPPEDGPEGRKESDRFLCVVEAELARLPKRRAAVELFLEFWVMGMTEQEIRRRIRARFDEFRAALRPLGDAMAAESPERYGDVGGRTLATVAVSLVEGCALQLASDPAGFDLEGYTRAVRALLRPQRPT